MWPQQAPCIARFYVNFQPGVWLQSRISGRDFPALNLDNPPHAKHAGRARQTGDNASGDGINVASISGGQAPWPHRHGIAIVSAMATESLEGNRGPGTTTSANVDGSFLARLNGVAADLEALLDRLLKPPPADGEIARPERLLAAMRYASLGGGKRLRPFLVVE